MTNNHTEMTRVEENAAGMGKTWAQWKQKYKYVNLNTLHEMLLKLRAMVPTLTISKYNTHVFKLLVIDSNTNFFTS